MPRPSVEKGLGSKNSEPSWVKVAGTSTKWGSNKFGSSSLGGTLHRVWTSESARTTTQPFPGETPLACGNSSGIVGHSPQRSHQAMKHSQKASLPFGLKAVGLSQGHLGSQDPRQVSSLRSPKHTKAACPCPRACASKPPWHEKSLARTVIVIVRMLPS